MKTYADLHIHSCLSPCAEDDMLPYNICAMAQLKGLQAVAITDHNTTANLPGAKSAADFFQLELVPGLEITSKEEVHILAYFSSLEKAMEAGSFITSRLPKIKNKPDFFGNQLIVDCNHQIIDVQDDLLIGATDLSVEEITQYVLKLEGFYVPAHINRGTYGILQKFGFLPEHIPFPILEVDPGMPLTNVSISNKQILHASDAHRLGDIFEACFFIETEQGESVFSLLKNFFNDNFV